jgi:protein phosphatase
MTTILKLTGYDLSDEGPGRTLNEDATLVREDLGLFALADGAGGRGKGNVAATLALRTLENYVGATVRRTFERADFDLLGLPEEAKRLSAAFHHAHGNLLEVLKAAPERKGMATTLVAMLFGARTEMLHVAHVGDSRCYRLRAGHLELLTEDHTVAYDVLQRRPEVAEDVLAALPRNSVVRALGMEHDFRVSVRTVSLLPGDRFLLASDGLTSVVPFGVIEQLLSEEEPSAATASELLSQALASHTQDNVAVLVVDVGEHVVQEDVPTQRYTEHPVAPPSAPLVEASEGPGSGELQGPEIAGDDLLLAIDSWPAAADFAATEPYIEPARLEPLVEPAPATQTSAELSSPPPPVGAQRESTSSWPDGPTLPRSAPSLGGLPRAGRPAELDARLGLDLFDVPSLEPLEPLELVEGEVSEVLVDEPAAAVELSPPLTDGPRPVEPALPLVRRSRSSSDAGPGDGEPS